MSLPAIPMLLLLLLIALIEAVQFITNLGKPKQEVKPTNKPENPNKPVLLATSILGRAVKKQLNTRRNKHDSEQRKI